MWRRTPGRPPLGSCGTAGSGGQGRASDPPACAVSVFRGADEVRGGWPAFDLDVGIVNEYPAGVPRSLGTVSTRLNAD
jgi:hypothetical protein